MDTVIRTTACETIKGLRVKALSGSLSCRRRSSRGKIGQLVEALFGETDFFYLLKSLLCRQWFSKNNQINSQ